LHGDNWTHNTVDFRPLHLTDEDDIARAFENVEMF
jgi:hypothetical protein